MIDSSNESEEGLPAGPERADENVAEVGPEPRVLPIRNALDLSGLIPNFSALIAPVVSDLLKGMSEQWSPFGDLAKLNVKIFPAITMPSIPDAPVMKSFAALLPDFDVTSSFAALLPDVDVTASINFPKFELPNFSGAFAALLEQLRDAAPPNWSPDIDEEKALSVVLDEGIPLVWVPRADIVDAVLSVEERNARLDLLAERQRLIVDDCRAVLAATNHESLGSQVPLASKAVEALASGHFEAAQALAVVVTETAVAQAISGSYEVVKRQVLFDPGLVPYNLIRLRGALAPIHRFYTSWWSTSGIPKPQELSRHISVHHADAGHYTEANAIVAVMLVTSVLRALQELQEVAAASEEGAA